MVYTRFKKERLTIVFTRVKKGDIFKIVYLSKVIFHILVSIENILADRTIFSGDFLLTSTEIEVPLLEE